MLETGTRAGDVDAHKAIKAVHHAGVDPDLLIEQEAVLYVVSGHIQSSDIHPHKVGSFQFADRELRKVLLKERQQRAVIPVKIFIKLLEPRLTLVVGGLKRKHTERIHLTQLVDIDYPVDDFLPVRIVGDDVGYSQTGDVERLAWRVHRDGIVLGYL